VLGGGHTGHASRASRTSGSSLNCSLVSRPVASQRYSFRKMWASSHLWLTFSCNRWLLVMCSASWFSSMNSALHRGQVVRRPASKLLSGDSAKAIVRIPARITDIPRSSSFRRRLRQDWRPANSAATARQSSKATPSVAARPWQLSGHAKKTDQQHHPWFSSHPGGDPGDLNSKPLWQRILIALAGPFANFILPSCS